MRNHRPPKRLTISGSFGDAHEGREIAHILREFAEELEQRPENVRGCEFALGLPSAQGIPP